MKEQLQEALVAVKNGEETRARAILAGLLKTQPDNVPAWVLLSKLAQTEVQKAAFLQKVLQLDPDNHYATTALSGLQGDAKGTEPREPVIAAAEDGEAAEPSVEAEAEAEAVPPAGAELVAAPEAKLPPPTGAAGDEPPAREPSAPETELPEADTVPPEVTEEMATPANAMPVSQDPHDYEAQAEADTLPPWLADDEEILDQAATGSPPTAEPPSPIDVPDWLQEEPEPAWAEEEEELEAAPLPASTPRPGAPAAEEDQRVAVPPAPERVPETTRAGLLIGLAILLIIVFLLLVYTALNFF